MNLPTISIPVQNAKVAYREYRRAVAERRSDEDRALMNGYAALAKGQQVVSLADAMRAAGTHPNGLPRLGIARADWRRCRVRRWTAGGCEFSCASAWADNKYPRGTVTLPDGTLETGALGTIRWNADASVPGVPPALRPADKGWPSKHYVLWETDWDDVPEDPALLKPLGALLYVVVATWDLTELEQAVLGMRKP